MSDSGSAPPACLVDGSGRIRHTRGVIKRSAVPANIAPLETAQGAWPAQVLYGATRLGVRMPRRTVR